MLMSKVAELKLARHPDSNRISAPGYPRNTMR